MGTITAVMRKLIELANALIRDGRSWAPKKLDQNGHSKQPMGWLQRRGFAGIRGLE